MAHLTSQKGRSASKYGIIVCIKGTTDSKCGTVDSKNGTIASTKRATSLRGCDTLCGSGVAYRTGHGER
eukprot:3933857-Rhodomonas_salina.2